MSTTSTDEEPDNSKMEKYLKKWRQNAFDAGQFDTAIFVGDKLLALTSQSFQIFLLCKRLLRVVYQGNRRLTQRQMSSSPSR